MNINEAIEQLKYYQNKPYVPTVRKVCDIALETIEALQQENNGWRERYDELDAGHSRLFKDFCKLQQENEQLQAQLARVREALWKARGALCKGISALKVHCKYFDNTPEEDACIEMYEAILEIDKVIGGKEDEK